MTRYSWTGSQWRNQTTHALGGTPNPGAGTILIFPAGSSANVLLTPGNLIGGTVLAYGGIVVGAGAQVNFGTFSSFDTSSYDQFAVGTLQVGVGAHVTMLGSIEGFPATETLHADRVNLSAGSTLDLGVAPVLSPDTIDSLTNNGGTFLAPTGAGSVAADRVLRLGGPGFVQASGFTQGESETNDGHGHTLIDLGGIAQGSAAAAIEELINNAPPGGTLTLQSSDGAFCVTQTAGGATLGVNTSMVGAHTALLTYASGGVTDTLTIGDRIVGG